MPASATENSGCWCRKLITIRSTEGVLSTLRLVANLPFAVRDCFMVCVKKEIEVVQCALVCGTVARNRPNKMLVTQPNLRTSTTPHREHTAYYPPSSMAEVHSLSSRYILSGFMSFFMRYPPVRDTVLYASL